jgi:U3 small nucleolar RNA-associated protein 4
VKLSAIELPAKLSSLGATQLKLSPDGRYLLAVQEGSRILMASIPAETPSGETYESSIRLQRLTRLRRQIPRYVLNGGLGTYDRSVTHISFSADSKMLAVADLAGYIDTWALRGHEQAIQNGEEMETGDDAASDSSDVDSSDEENETATDMQDRWIRNPNAKLLPKLPTSPAVMSFSDYVPDSVSSTPSKEGVEDYILVAVTSSWNVLAFNPRHGALTPWSRRHPRKALPAPVQDLLDLPKGILWQGSRMWLYGVSFLLMLDMGQDISTSSEVEGGDMQLVHGTKRKRTGPTSGAGGKMERENLAPHQVRKHGAGEQWEDVDVAEPPQVDESDSDEEMVDVAAPNDNNETAMQATQSTSNEPKKWWITYKYRPILGIVPLDSPGHDLEIALVERPNWDVDMPEKYFAGDDWAQT